jgi:hypothetical protein
MWRFYDTLLEKFAVMPGVLHVAGSIDTPYTGANSNGDFSYEGQASGATNRNLFADFHSVTPGYFATVQTPILEGRDFTAGDKPDSPKVAIINLDMAQ